MNGLELAALLTPALCNARVVVIVCVLTYGVCLPGLFLFYRDPNARIGRFSWLVFAALICETLLEIKMGWEILILPLHRYAYIAWGVSGLIFLVWVFWHFTLPFRDMPIVGRYFKTMETTIKKIE